MRERVGGSRLPLLTAFKGIGLGHELVDELAELWLSSAKLRWIAAAIRFGRDTSKSWRADEPRRRKHRAIQKRIQRRGEVEIRVLAFGNHLVCTVDDGTSHWSQPRGNPLQRIRAEVRRELLRLGVKPRDLRERLLDLIEK